MDPEVIKIDVRLAAIRASVDGTLPVEKMHTFRYRILTTRRDRVRARVNAWLARRNSTPACFRA